jgi:hypothetical protein
MAELGLVRQHDGIWVYCGPLGEHYANDSLVGRALTELAERREAAAADADDGADAEAEDAPESEPVSPMTAAIESAVIARDDVKAALAEAITSTAHFHLCAVVSGLTQVLQFLEQARKADSQ